MINSNKKKTKKKLTHTQKLVLIAMGNITDIPQTSLINQVVAFCFNSQLNHSFIIATDNVYTNSIN